MAYVNRQFSSEQPGLEVASHAYNKQPGLELARHDYSKQPGLEIASQPYGKQPGVSAWKQDRRVCGLRRQLFIRLVIVAIVIVAVAAIGGGVGGSLANKKSTDHANSSPAVSIAVAEFGNGATIGVFYQNSTNDLYISAEYTLTGGLSPWHEPIKINGLNPSPKVNSPIAAVYSFTDQALVSIYYAAENNTIFDAHGLVSSSEWLMGTLASDTNYMATVADDGGIAANPWMLTNAIANYSSYSIRVYYLDQYSTQIKEIAKDPDAPYVITAQNFPTIGGGSKIATAWFPGDNFANTTNQVQHLFYLDDNDVLSHYPGFNGNWNETDIENLASTLTKGQPIASTVGQDTPASNVLRIFWLDNRTGSVMTINCERTLPCGAAANISSINPGEVHAGPIAAVAYETSKGDEVRVYYSSIGNSIYLTEAGFEAEPGASYTYETFGLTFPR